MKISIVVFHLFEFVVFHIYANDWSASTFFLSNQLHHSCLCAVHCW